MDTETCMDDLDGIIRQMSTLGTENKEDLVKKMHMYTNYQMTQEGCLFFLEMNNWNLQGAIGSYFDSTKSNYATDPLQASLVRDITIGDGEAVPPNTEFVKTWRIQNSGQVGWPPSCSLRYVSGHKMEAPDFVLVGGLEPGDETNVSVTLKSPSYQGLYQSQWRMQTPTGTVFGETIWVIIQVSADGLLDITQRMSQFSSGELGHPLVPNTNDFQQWLPQNTDSLVRDTNSQSEHHSIFSFHSNEMPPSDGPKDTDMS